MTTPSDFRTHMVRHRDQEVRVLALKDEGHFYFPIDYRIDSHELFSLDGGWWDVLDVRRGPNATVVTASLRRAAHQHEAWMIREAPDGSHHYCAACGEAIAPVA